MSVQAAAGRAESAPTLGCLDHSRYFLGTLQDSGTRGILKKVGTPDTQPKRDETKEVDGGLIPSFYDAPGERQRPAHADKFCRRKRVTFSPLVSYCNIIPYSEVYSRHPREFVFDALGNEIVVRHTVPEFNARETRIEGTDLSALLLVNKLTLAEQRSLEEEFEMTTSRRQVCSRHIGSQSNADSLMNSPRCTGHTPVRRNAIRRVLAQVVISSRAPRSRVLSPR